MRELDAAGITDARLRASYARARGLHAAHGRTYFLATLLLPVWKRPYVHALYGFARYADDIVDDLDSELSAAERAAALRGWGERFLTALRDGVSADAVDAELTAGLSSGPGWTGSAGWTGGASGPREEVSVLPATVDTIRRFALDPEHFRAFLTSMTMDLTVTGYATWEDLLVYMHGSAAVIGLQMVPVLEPVDGSALPYARDLGLAFQLANFIRDVGEDLRRGRVYLPATSLDLFGVTREHLAAGVVDGAVRRLLAFEISRARELFRAAEPGIRLLHPTSRDCMRTAFVLYRAILDEVERADYRVLERRVSVSTPRRLAVAGPALVRATRAHRRHRGDTQISSRPPR
ncbi:phytoene/squalene synthase family protein [Frankia sp. AgKG'84/4]|uniref:phytoene/squalene synthase family protein n=1 Tax=Frankia sp. AgKG'84/4 TaxID=573490 RepID=UPI00200BED4E|nr:phytoene/squalene synthase family protein [Frankia sp. AgKG'84/4]MCL9795796.1 phytoene/squalene synthase family protein [Frankia sp. AgKG'84/4]